jgi:hypothetical protein
MSESIQVCARPRVTAVGSREDFERNVACYTDNSKALQMQLGQMVAYAFAAYHRSKDTWPIDHIRAEVSLPKASAARLDKALTRITRATLAEGETPAKAGIAFANDFIADYFAEESQKRKEAREKAKAKRDEDAAKRREQADKAEERAKKAEAERDEMAEALADTTREFTLCGEDGNVTPLTPEEYTYLAMMLADMRSDRDTVKAEARRTERDHAKAQLEAVA